VADFITNGSAVLPAVKSDARVPSGATTEWTAEDANDLRQALLDTRGAVLGLQTAAAGGLNINNPSASSILATGSTAPRTLAARFSEVTNILDYGADPTGGTDSTAAIQSAINAAPSGSTVLVPNGSYLISTGLTVSSALRIAGYGKAQSKLIGTSGQTVLTVLNAGANVYDLALSDLMIAFTSGNSSSVGISAGNATYGMVHFSLDRVSITNTNKAGNGVLFNNALVGSLTDCVVTGWDNSLNLLATLGPDIAITVRGGEYSNSNIAFNIGAAMLRAYGPVLEGNTNYAVKLSGTGSPAYYAFGTYYEGNGTADVYVATSTLAFVSTHGCQYTSPSAPTNLLVDAGATTPRVCSIGDFYSAAVTNNCAATPIYLLLPLSSIGPTLTGPITMIMDTANNSRRGILSADYLYLRSNVGNTLGGGFYEYADGAWKGQINALAGISTTSTGANNLRGSAQFSSAATKSVTFGTAEADSSYFVALSGSANETFWVTSKGTGGFTLNSSNATSTATVDWHLIR